MKNTPKGETPSIQDQTQFKDLMSQVPTSVAVISLLKENDLKACTISSFISVDIANPTILFVLKNDSTTLAAIESESKFAVNLLAANQSKISDLYASREKQSRIEESTDWTINEIGIPTLASSKSVLICELISSTKLDSATVVLAKVCEFDLKSTELPLVYYSRSYLGVYQD